MKRQLILLTAAALALCGCAEKDTPATGYGSLVVNEATDLQIDTRAQAAAPTGEFSVEISGAGYAEKWSSVAAFNASETQLKEGDYTVRIAAGDPDAEGVGMPYYTGEATARVVAQTTARATVTASVANSEALVTATERFLTYFHDAEFTLTTAAGNRFTFRPGTETPGEAVSVRTGGSLTVTGTARRQSLDGTSEGPTATFRAEPLAAAKARTRHTFVFDAAEAGSARIDITLEVWSGNDEKFTQTVDVELNDAAIE